MLTLIYQKHRSTTTISYGVFICPSSNSKSASGPTLICTSIARDIYHHSATVEWRQPSILRRVLSSCPAVFTGFGFNSYSIWMHPHMDVKPPQETHNQSHLGCEISWPLTPDMFWRKCVCLSETTLLRLVVPTRTLTLVNRRSTEMLWI